MGVLVIYMPETRGRSLENIQEGFELAPGAQRLKGLTSRATTIRSKQSSQSSSPDDSSGENISAFSTGPGLEMAR